MVSDQPSYTFYPITNAPSHQFYEYFDSDVTIDDLIHKYNASVYHLRKITNAKLRDFADPGDKRNYLTKIKVYACFLKVGEIGIKRFIFNRPSSFLYGYLFVYLLCYISSSLFS